MVEEFVGAFFALVIVGLMLLVFQAAITFRDRWQSRND